MNRTAFLALLTALVSRGTLTTEQAGALLRAFDGRRFGREAFPLLASEAGYAVTAAAATEAAGFVAPGALGLTYEARADLLDGILDSFGREMDRRTALLYQTAEEAGAAARSAGSVRRWHLAMRDAIAEDMLAAAQLGYGPGGLPPDVLRRVQAAVTEQTAYLSRFADEVAARRMLEQEGLGTAMTRADVAQRARQYGGRSRAMFYEIGEAREAEERGEGWVAQYDALDGDPGTCSPCIEAEQNGPYLPASGPFPGSVCRGRGHCRCARRLIYSPADYERLTSTALAA